MLAGGEGGRIFFRQSAILSSACLFKVSFYPVLVRFFGLVRGRLDVARTPVHTGMLCILNLIFFFCVIGLL